MSEKTDEELLPFNLVPYAHRPSFTADARAGFINAPDRNAAAANRNSPLPENDGVGMEQNERGSQLRDKEKK